MKSVESMISETIRELRGPLPRCTTLPVALELQGARRAHAPGQGKTSGLMADELTSTGVPRPPAPARPGWMIAGAAPGQSRRQKRCRIRR